MTRVFISYSRRDMEFVRRLTDDLKQLGADVWIDVDDIPAGMNWSTAVQQGLDTSDVVIVVISPDSIESTNVENEWQYFLDQGRSVIPIRWRPAQVHFQLRRLQYIDFHNQNYTTALAQLHSELRRQGIILAPLDILITRSLSPLTKSTHGDPSVKPAHDSSPHPVYRHPAVMGAILVSVVIVVMAVFLVLHDDGLGKDAAMGEETSIPRTNTAAYVADAQTATALRLITPIVTPSSAMPRPTKTFQPSDISSSTPTAQPEANALAQPPPSVEIPTTAAAKVTPTLTRTPTLSVTNTLPPSPLTQYAVQFTIIRSAESVTVCTNRTIDFADLTVKFGPSIWYSFDEFPTLSNPPSGNCWCLQQEGTYFPIAAACNESNTSLEKYDLNWRNREARILLGETDIGGCQAQPDEVDLYQCVLNYGG